MSRFNRRSTLAAVALIAALALAASAVTAKTKGKSEHGTVHFAITHSVGKVNISAGDVTDSLFGSGAAVFHLHVLPNSSGSLTITIQNVTLFYSTGSASGTATATLNITNKPQSGDATVTGGVIKLTKGFGTHKGHTFTGTFSGSGSVSGGTYTIKYKGTYH